MRLPAHSRSYKRRPHQPQRQIHRSKEAENDKESLRQDLPAPPFLYQHPGSKEPAGPARGADQAGSGRVLGQQMKQ